MGDNTINRGEELEAQRLEAANNAGALNEKKQATEALVGKDYDITKIDFVRMIQDALSNGNLEQIKEVLGQNPEEAKRIIISELENDGYDLDKIKETLRSIGISASDSEINAPDADDLDVDDKSLENQQGMSFTSLMIEVLDVLLNEEEEEKENEEEIDGDDIENEGSISEIAGAIADLVGIFSGAIERAVEKIEENNQSKENDLLPPSKHTGNNFSAPTVKADGHGNNRGPNLSN